MMIKHEQRGLYQHLRRIGFRRYRLCGNAKTLSRGSIHYDESFLLVSQLVRKFGSVHRVSFDVVRWSRVLKALIEGPSLAASGLQKAEPTTF